MMPGLIDNVPSWFSRVRVISMFLTLYLNMDRCHTNGPAISLKGSNRLVLRCFQQFISRIKAAVCTMYLIQFARQLPFEVEKSFQYHLYVGG